MMKKWQHGYELDYLLEKEKFYSRYNEYSCSPFSAVKKNTIATGLHEKTLTTYETGWHGSPSQKIIMMLM